MTIGNVWRYVGWNSSRKAIRKLHNHAVSVYFPHPKVYNQYMLKGRIIPPLENEKPVMRHPLFPAVNIELLNVNPKHYLATVIVKLKPIGDWKVQESSFPQKVTVRDTNVSCPDELRHYINTDEIPSFDDMCRFYELFGHFYPVGTIVSTVPNSEKMNSFFTIGRLRRSPSGTEKLTYFVPDDPSKPAILSKSDEHTVLVEQNGPEVRYFSDYHLNLLRRKNLRSREEMNEDRQKLLLKHGLEVTEFSKSALCELNLSIPSDEELSKRRDFRSVCVFSIDPPTARDVDDALHVRQLSHDTYEVGVHIADVTHYVKYNGHLSREAGNRGNSIYLGDEVIHMLPRELSEDLCSLHPGSPKLTMSVIFTMNSRGEVISEPWIGQSVISSSAKLSYEQTDKILAGEESEMTIHSSYTSEDVKSSLLILNTLAKQMRARRFDNGALLIGPEKLAVRIDEGDEAPVIYDTKKTGDSSKLIEEFMLLANTTVADFLKKHLPQNALLRIHPDPMVDKLRNLKPYFTHAGIKFRWRSSKELQRSMDQLIEHYTKNEDKLTREGLQQFLSLLYIKTMSLAQYVRGSVKKTWHYGLAVNRYTHFTSPIRRYADMVVHYQVKAILNRHGNENPDPRFVREIADVCNVKRRATKKLTHDLNAFHLLNAVQATGGSLLAFAFVISCNSTTLTFFCPQLEYVGTVDLVKQSNIIDWHRTPDCFYVRFSSRCQHKRILPISKLTKVVCGFAVDDDMKIASSLISPRCAVCDKSSFFEGAKFDEVTESQPISDADDDELKDSVISVLFKKLISLWRRTPKNKAG